MSNSSRNSSSCGRNSDESADDFIMLDEPQELVIRSGKPQSEHTLRIDLNPIKSNKSFLLSIHPPAKPSDDIKHVGGDIVLVIDVSGSMGALAPVPELENQKEKEASNLTVLDLVRHACRTILSTLNEGDRLALITFASEVDVVQSLTHMTDDAKAETLGKIEKLKVQGMTNLWGGIKAGIKEFKNSTNVGNVQGLYILTDGQPNVMCPQQGYVRKLKPLLDGLINTPTIQTFGFGYNIRSDLMLSIAKVGNGSYAFIPDAGMIGTVFVHAVANHYATYATNVSLELTVPASSPINLHHNSGLPCKQQAPNCLQVELGNVQYGQSRDLVVFCEEARGIGEISAKVTYTQHHQSPKTIWANFSANQPRKLPQTLLDYHYHRNSFCQFLSELYPVTATSGEHVTAPRSTADTDVDTTSAFENLVSQLTQNDSYRADPNISSLLSDLVGSDLNPKTPKKGQIYQALQTRSIPRHGHSSESYWQKWGRHYLSSLWCAHMRQNCNSFKDAGPLRYGMDSELFKQCRDELDQAFDNLPPPKGTANVRHGADPVHYVPVSMSRYNRSDCGCFLGTCTVTLADGTNTTVEALRVGMSILNPLTNSKRTIKQIVKSVKGSGGEICRVSKNLWITPWHPIFDTSRKTWIFPQTVAEETRTLQDDEGVFSILLEPSTCADDHAVEISGVPCVTLGHGLTSRNDNDDIRAHPFFGNYDVIEHSLGGLAVDYHRRKVCAGFLKDSETGLAHDFAAADFEVGGDESSCCEERGFDQLLSCGMREILAY